MFKKFGGEISNNIRQYEKPDTDIYVMVNYSIITEERKLNIFREASNILIIMKNLFNYY